VLIIVHLRYSLANVPPQPNFPLDDVSYITLLFTSLVHIMNSTFILTSIS
jgi:hypothetical protein